MPEGFSFSGKDIDKVENFLKKYPRAVTNKIIAPAQRNAMTIVRQDLKRRIRGLKNLKSARARQSYAKAVLSKSKVYRRTGRVWVGVGIASGTTNFIRRDDSGNAIDSIQDWSKLSHLFEFGVKPHEISTKRFKTLKFLGVGGTETHVKGTVTHPGINAEPHIRPAMRNNVNKVEAKFAANLSKLFDKHADVIAQAEGLKRAR